MIRIEDLVLSILTKATVIPEFKSKDGDLNDPAVKIGRNCLVVSDMTTPP